MENKKGSPAAEQTGNGREVGERFNKKTPISSGETIKQSGDISFIE